MEPPDIVEVIVSSRTGIAERRRLNSVRGSMYVYLVDRHAINRACHNYCLVLPGAGSRPEEDFVVVSRRAARIIRLNA
jgi:hypothetical protein